MTSPAPSSRTTVRRKRDRATYDASAIEAILDEGLVCHLGAVVDGTPVVLPTTYARRDRTLYLHGASGNALLRAAVTGGDVCVSVTLVDGLVLARSAFHHSINYRSVVVFGRPREVTDLEDKHRAMTALVEHVVPGRSAATRSPSEQELRATLVAALPLDEASAKVRTGPPVDDDADVALGHWAGVLPLSMVPGTPIPDRAVPAHVRAWRRPGG